MAKIPYSHEEVEVALIDILMGNQAWYEIKNQTGLSGERCKEIEKLYFQILDNTLNVNLK